MQALHAVALRLKASAKAYPGGRDVPALLFFTDPERTPRPWRAAEALPAGCGVVYRAFAASDAVQVGLKVAEACRARGLVLLAGADPDLARAIGAHGLHLPERLLAGLPALKRQEPGWMLTAAAHGEAALRAAAEAGADAAVLSPVFPSNSPSAGPPLGVERFTALVAGAGLPVYALGGVDMKNAPELLGSGAAGIASVSAVART